jgi:hypothetical protein
MDQELATATRGRVQLVNGIKRKIMFVQGKLVEKFQKKASI